MDGIIRTTLVGTSSVNINGLWTELSVAGSYRFLGVYLMAGGSPNHGLDLAEIQVHGFAP